MADTPTLPPKVARIHLRIADSDVSAWREAAVKEKQTLSEWIRRACDERVAAMPMPKKRG